MTHTKYFFVKRQNGTVVDIPERDLEPTLKRNPSWEVIEGKLHWEDIVITMPATVQDSSTVACPLCTREFTTQQGLRVHKRSHK